MARKIVTNLFICVTTHKVIQIWVVMYDKFHTLFIFQIYIFLTANCLNDSKFD